MAHRDSHVVVTNVDLRNESTTDGFVAFRPPTSHATHVKNDKVDAPVVAVKPQLIISYLTPQEVFNALVETGIAKSRYSYTKLIVMGFLAGVFVGFGGAAALIVAGGLGVSAGTIGAMAPGLSKLALGSIFPVALMLIIFAGADLFTGDTMYMTCAFLSGKVTWKKLLRSWVSAWLTNFAGAVFMAYFGTYLCNVADADPWLTYLGHLSHAKVHQYWWVVLLKGIGANWLVCLAIYLAYAATSYEGKLIGMWWPILTFVLIGYEHCIANMYYLTAAVMYAGTMPSEYKITFGEFIARNLIPATIGNIIGGAVFVGGLNFIVFHEPKHNAVLPL